MEHSLDTILPAKMEHTLNIMSPAKMDSFSRYSINCQNGTLDIVLPANMEYSLDTILHAKMEHFLSEAKVMFLTKQNVSLLNTITFFITTQTSFSQSRCSIDVT